MSEATTLSKLGERHSTSIGTIGLPRLAGEVT